MVEEKVSAAIRLARFCVGGSSRPDVVGEGSLLEGFGVGCSLCASSRGYTLRYAMNVAITNVATNGRVEKAALVPNDG